MLPHFGPLLGFFINGNSQTTGVHMVCTYADARFTLPEGGLVPQIQSSITVLAFSLPSVRLVRSTSGSFG